MPVAETKTEPEEEEKLPSDPWDSETCASYFKCVFDCKKKWPKPLQRYCLIPPVPIDLLQDRFR